MDGRAVIATCVLLVVAGVAGTAGVGAAQSAESATIDRTMTLGLTPEEPGRIAVTLDYDFPDSLRSFEVTVPEESVVESADGFEQASLRRYDWTGEGESASLTVEVAANESSTGGRAQAAGGNYDFLDAGPWALVRIPQTSSRWSWAGGDDSSVSLTTTHRVAGEGYVGDTMAFLGPHEQYRRTVAGQTFTLIVPDAADLTESPDDVLDSLGAASRSLRVGDRDPRVNVFTAPSGMSWGARGIQYGDTDAWVLADAELARASNTWLHEYVHTRQAFQTATEMRWLTEASAEYYGALLALQQDRITYRQFRDHLERGQRAAFADTVLARPGTWSTGSQYYRGALVVAAVDRQMRLASDGSATFADAFDALNVASPPVTGPAFEATIGDLSTATVADRAAYWTTTTAVPDTWNSFEHRRAFATTPATVDLGAGAAPVYRVSGPYGERSATTAPTLYPGETLAVNFTAENVGEVSGTETIALARNGTQVDAATLTLDPGETTPLTLGATFAETGTYALTAGLQRIDVTVAEPAPLAIAGVSADETSVESGDTVNVTVDVAADAETPSRGTVAVAVDGETADSHEVALGAGETATVESTVTLRGSGERTISVGNESVTVTVESPGGGSGGVPGFGVGAALVAAATVALAAARYR